jgi:hypothetical protein
MSLWTDGYEVENNYLLLTLFVDRHKNENFGNGETACHAHLLPSSLSLMHYYIRARANVGKHRYDSF